MSAQPLAAVSMWCRRPWAPGFTLGDIAPADLSDRVEAQRAALFGDQDWAGAIVLLPLGNRIGDLVVLLAAWAAGACPLLIDDSDGASARAAARRLAGDVPMVVLDREPRLDGVAGARSSPGGAVLMTSGSTGAPQLAARTAESLDAEADRYRRLLDLDPHAAVVIAAPLSHAYALGWLRAAMRGGWRVDALPPTALGAIAKRLVDGADWAAMTPAIARLLALRGRARPARIATRVMVGAGPVDRDLDAAFAHAFGVGLARNYGSSETGALFASLTPEPPACVGTAMPGIAYRLVDDRGDRAVAGEAGWLEIRSDGAWHAMDDLVRIDQAGRLTVIARRSGALRIGDRWVAPREVEQRIAALAPLRAVRVANGDGRTPAVADRIVADIWPLDPLDFDAGAFAVALDSLTGEGLRPQQVRLRSVLERAPAGKPRSPTVWHPGSAATLAEAARAYKRSELLFALGDLGILAQVDGRSDGDAIADRLGLDAGTVELLLALAARYGIVARSGQGAGATEAIVDFEATASRSAVTRDRLATLARTGPAAAATPRRAGFWERYRDAMDAPPHRFRTRFGLRQLALRDGARLLELSSGGALYGAEAEAISLSLDAAHCRVGAGRTRDERAGRALRAAIAAGPYDAIVLRNALRSRGVAAQLGRLTACLAPRGTLLIDDLFLTDEAATADFALDWLTHGGLALQTLAELVEHVATLDLDCRVASVPHVAGARIVACRPASEVYDGRF
ncbi:MAG: long-chain fatty acid--CoA ligase [Sphingomonadales bacterium]|nr:long-chain fatty acid--CoA ligase [Sphingomonadales bacterium]